MMKTPPCFYRSPGKDGLQKEWVVFALGQLMGPGIFQSPHVGCVKRIKKS